MFFKLFMFVNDCFTREQVVLARGYMSRLLMALQSSKCCPSGSLLTDRVGWREIRKQFSHEFCKTTLKCCTMPLEVSTTGLHPVSVNNGLFDSP